MQPIEQTILGLSEAELDAFPLGIIRLDRTGNIMYYNQAEADLARRSADTAVGLNFFRDVAPCTAVQQFQGRFNAFIKTPNKTIEQFTFLFRFGWGSKQVRITFVRRAGDEERVYVVVNATTA